MSNLIRVLTIGLVIASLPTLAADLADHCEDWATACNLDPETECPLPAGSTEDDSLYGLTVLLDYYTQACSTGSYIKVGNLNTGAFVAINWHTAEDGQPNKHLFFRNSGEQGSDICCDDGSGCDGSCKGGTCPGGFDPVLDGCEIMDSCGICGCEVGKVTNAVLEEQDTVIHYQEAGCQLPNCTGSSGSSCVNDCDATAIDCAAGSPFNWCVKLVLTPRQSAVVEITNVSFNAGVCYLKFDTPIVLDESKFTIDESDCPT